MCSISTKQNYEGEFFCMKKTLKSRLLGSFTSAFMAVSSVVSSATALPFIVGSADDIPPSYPKTYTMENVLTDFQYFIKDDFTGSGHVVGAIAVGGTFDKINTICDGQITPSFIYDVKQATVGHANYVKGDKTVYYATNSSGKELSENFVQNPAYINMESAFEKLTKQSEKIASESRTVTADEIKAKYVDGYDSKILDIDVEGGNVAIPWSVYSEISVINLTGFANADYFKENQFIVSVVDVPEDEAFNLSANYGVNRENDTVNITWNGEVGEKFFFDNMTGFGADVKTQEINLEGLRLIWNLPDAEFANVTALGGHLFAPNADVEIVKCGRFEGSVVAETLVNDNGAEAHFYTLANPFVPIAVADTVISKKDSNTNDELKGAKLEIIADENNPAQLDEVTASNDSTIINTATGVISWISDSTPNEIKNLPEGSYTLVETAAPAGYTVASSINFVISPDGTVEWEGASVSEVDGVITMFDDITSVTVSKVEILGDGTKNELDGAILSVSGESFKKDNVALYYLDGTEKIKVKHSYFELADGTEGVSWETTGKETIIEGLPVGDYDLTEITAPNGYAVAESIPFSIGEDGKLVGGEKLEMIDGITSVTVSKVEILGDGTKKELDGATLVINGSESDYSNVKLYNIDNGVKTPVKFTTIQNGISWETTGKETVIEGLPSGDYSMKEITVPNGYVRAEEVKFSIGLDGKLVGGDKVEMVDAITSVTVSKIEILGDGTKNELNGAELSITGSSFNSENVCLYYLDGGKQVEVDFTEIDGGIKWKTNGFETVINGLPSGNYTLTEITAPYGYEIAESIDFTIGMDGKLVDAEKVEMVDAKVTTTTTKATTTTTTTTKATTTTTTTTKATTTTTTTAKATTTTTTTTKATTTTTTTTKATTTTTTTTKATTTTTTTTKATTTTTTTTKATTTTTTTTKATTTTTTTTKATTTTTTTTKATTTTTTTTKATTTTTKKGIIADFIVDETTTTSTVTTTDIATTTASDTTTATTTVVTEILIEVGNPETTTVTTTIVTTTTPTTTTVIIINQTNAPPTGVSAPVTALIVLTLAASAAVVLKRKSNK